MANKVRPRRVVKERSAAVLSIFDAPKMSAEGRREVANWLRQCARNLMKDGPLYTEGRFTARYLYA